MTSRRHERDRFGKEDAHRIPQRDGLLVGRPLDLDLLQRGSRELDGRVEGQRRELLALRLVHSLRLTLGELTQAAHQLVGVAAERKAESSLHDDYSTGMPAGTFTDALNEQIANELAASQQYLAIAIYYDRETLPQLAGHFYRQALEERNHAMMIVQYLLDADAPVVVPAVAGPQTDFSDAVAPVSLALEQERRVTDQITRLAGLARDEGDLVGAQFLDWFLKEQREEVSSMSALLAMVERASASNLLLAEDYLARVGMGEEDADPTAPPAAGGAL